MTNINEVMCLIRGIEDDYVNFSAGGFLSVGVIPVNTRFELGALNANEAMELMNVICKLAAVTDCDLKYGEGVR